VFLLVPAYPGSPGTKAIKRFVFVVVVGKQNSHNAPWAVNKKDKCFQFSVKLSVANVS